MATVQVANYHFLADSVFTLEANHVKRLKFSCPPASRFVKEFAAPVLSYTLLPKSDTCKFIVVINDIAADPNNIPASKIAVEIESDTQVRRDLHEVMSGNLFNPGVDNFVDFRVVIGKVQFSDVILFHRISINVPD